MLSQFVSVLCAAFAVLALFVLHVVGGIGAQLNQFMSGICEALGLVCSGRAAFEVGCLSVVDAGQPVLVSRV